MRCLVSLTVILALSFAVSAQAQFKEGEAGGAKLGPSQTHKWRCGVVIKAVGGPCKGIIGYVPVPSEWPEQKIKIAQQDVTPSVKISYQMVDETARMMMVRIAYIQGNEEAKALMTLEIERSAQKKPEDTGSFTIPKGKEITSSIRRYLGVSPMIEIQNAAVRKAAKEVGADKEKAWDHVEAIYDWTREHVDYKTGQKAKGAARALKEKNGGHDDMAAVFIAVCRAAGIPARTVWVPEFSYAEFYLIDKKGEGHWIPASPAGARMFGEMPDTKPIMAKGDSFRPPYPSKEKLLPYLREDLVGSPAGHGGQPNVKFVREFAN